MIDQILFNVGFVLVIVGFAVTFIAALVLALTAAKGKGRVRGGGAVMIGPIPIIFGTDKESVKILLILSIVLIVLMLVFMMFSGQILR